MSQVAHTSSKKMQFGGKQEEKEEEEKNRKENVEINDSEELTECNIFVRQQEETLLAMARRRQ